MRESFATYRQTPKAVLVLLAAGLWCGVHGPLHAQSLALHDQGYTAAALTSTTVRLSGKSELHLTEGGDPLNGSSVDLDSPDSWVFFHAVAPDVVNATLLGRLKVGGEAARNGENVRVAAYGGRGAVVLPHPSAFAPLTIYSGPHFTGKSKQLKPFLAYDGAAGLAPLSGVRSFRLKRGYTATLAVEGVGQPGTARASRNYVAADGDLEVSLLPASLDGKVGFLRVFDWRWTAKKGIAGNIAQGLNVGWWYNWNLDQNSLLTREYVPIRQNRYWPGLGQDWRSRGASHLLGYNEPDHADQANISVGDAIYSWPDILSTGLRAGSPAVTDGGVDWWLKPFMQQADGSGLRVDFVAVHYYRSFWNAGDPNGATSQFYNFLKNIHDATGRPIWVTEWNNGANWTNDPRPSASQQRATVSAMINMLEDTPWVERYALYNWVEDVRRVKWDDGSLTPAGEVYRDKLSKIGYRQLLPDSRRASKAVYNFEGQTHDISGNGNDAMLAGVGRYVPGKVGQAIELDGKHGWLQLPANIGRGNEFTFAGWVKWDGGSNWQRIFDLGADESRYLFLTPNSGANLRFAIRGGGSEQQLNAPPLTPGRWTHLAVTLGAGTGKLYVNGIVAATNTNMSYKAADGRPEYNYLGKSQFSRDPLFRGQLDDIRFYPTVLGASQIADMATGRPPAFVPSSWSLEATENAWFSSDTSRQVTGGKGGLTFSKMGGPGWISVGPDGRLFGWPRAEDLGANELRLKVQDSTGAMDVATVTIHVSADLGAQGPRVGYAFDGNLLPFAGLAEATGRGVLGYASGVDGPSLRLLGNDAWVELPEGIASSPEVSFSLWFRYHSATPWQRLFDFGSGTGQYLFLTPRSAAGNLRFVLKPAGANEEFLETTAPALRTWNHVVVTLGHGSGALYLNGNLVDARAMSATPDQVSQTANFLGKSQFSIDPTLNGGIDEFMIFNRKLDAGEVQHLFSGDFIKPKFRDNPLVLPPALTRQMYEQSLSGNLSPPATGLVFSKVAGPAWITVSPDGRLSGVPGRFDVGTAPLVVRAAEGAGLPAQLWVDIAVREVEAAALHYRFDGSLHEEGTGEPAVLTGSEQYAPGWLDQALRLDGSSSVKLPLAPLASLNEFTVAARVKWDGGAAWQRVFDFGVDTSRYMILTPASPEGTMRFLVTSSGTSNQEQLNAPMALPMDEWAHVAVTRTGNTGTLYLDGVPVATGPLTSSPAQLAVQNCYLGKSQWSSDPLFRGLIDDFRVYSRGLSRAEIAALATPPPAEVVPDSSYAAWAAGWSFPGGQEGPAADPDGDGIPNAIEYLLGSDPLVADPSALPRARLMSATELGLAGGKHYLGMDLRHRARHLGTFWAVEATDGLPTPWTADTVRKVGVIRTEGDFQTTRHYYERALEDSDFGRAFLRLWVHAP